MKYFNFYYQNKTHHESKYNSIISSLEKTTKNDIWAYYPAPRHKPAQGWKLHVSAHLLNYSEIVEKIVPTLIAKSYPFKLLVNLEHLRKLNAGFYGYTQIGKTITIYPRTCSDLRRCVRLLKPILQGAEHPRVPLELHFSNTPLYTRYGLFSGNGSLVSPNDLKFEDDRTNPFPPWSNSFQKKNIYKIPRVLPPAYLIHSPVTSRGKGSVYLGVDISSSPGELLFIKEGLKYGEVEWNGSDGMATLRKSISVSNSLYKNGINVPAIRYVDNFSDRLFIAYQKIEESNCNPRLTIANLSAELKKLHFYGYVWRDCKPMNFKVSNRGVYLIDIENITHLASIGDDRPVGTAWYSPTPEYKRIISHKSDIYSFAVSALELLADLKPDRHLVGISPLNLISKIDNLQYRELLKQSLNPNPNKRPNISILNKQLTSLSI